MGDGRRGGGGVWYPIGDAELRGGGEGKAGERLGVAVQSPGEGAVARRLGSAKRWLSRARGGGKAGERQEVAV